MADHPTPDDIARLANTSMPLVKLLEFFNFRVRDLESIPAISAQLAAAGLTTDPPFAECRHKATLRIIPADGADDTPDDTAEDDLEPDTMPRQRFTVGELANKLESVSSADSLAHALTLMRTKGYSQMPVVDGSSALKGVVTWDSLALLKDRHLEWNLANAMDTEPPMAEAHADLFQRLPELCQRGYLLVRDNCGQLTGIVTAADVADRFHTMALPFFLIGEIEALLRHCLRDLDPDNVKAVQGKKGSGKVTDLMFGGYVQLLRLGHDNPTLAARADANWKKLNWPTVDRALFVHRLSEVKRIRNSIAHFDRTPPTEAELTELRQFRSLLKQLA
ncbi:CBS domain-containing protein [Nocardia otitidiscaviarum]|uniref:CBS domain-containing protein n=1 Tax=Nocardia otitidiscaviarum TaxID=1823 RepID=UPI0024549255|nr:CBS domain-containing protein [Nocardia otitidiscaviarum]